MKRTHPAFWGFGWAGLFVGALLAVLGMADNGEIARLSGGYGLLVAGAALYLLAGLGLRQTLAGRSTAQPASTSSPAAQPQN